MAETGNRPDPFMAFRFEIKIDGLSAGGFSECSGLTLETEIKDFEEGGQNRYVHKFPTRTKQTNITLKRGVTDKKMWDWYMDIVNGQITPTSYKSGSILVYDPSGGQVVMEWQFSRAFPCKWSGPELDAKQSNVAVETFELCHHGLTRRK
ncbi:MAG: phage tail protein [Chloroflexota bacterium]